MCNSDEVTLRWSRRRDDEIVRNLAEKLPSTLQHVTNEALNISQKDQKSK